MSKGWSGRKCSVQITDQNIAVFKESIAKEGRKGGDVTQRKVDNTKNPCTVLSGEGDV